MIFLFYILSIYTLSLIIRDISGPFNIFNLLRNLLLRNKLFGVFFYEMFSCPICIGFHCGYLIYLISDYPFSFSQFGSAITYFLDLITRR
jgi:hypothetical protein